MNRLKISSYAKINLFLDIINKREDNYHNIKSVMQTISLKDEIEVIESNSDIKINCSNPKVPVDNSNTVYKAAKLIIEKYNINKGVIINIKKTIPIEAGLAGGSSNAASVIEGLNKLWKLNMCKEVKNELGIKIGSDVPYCLTGGTALVEGIGDKVTKYQDYKCDNILIVKPSFSISTALVYKLMDPKYYNIYKNNKMLYYIKNNEHHQVSKCIANTLEKVVERIYPEINSIKNYLIEYKAISSIMTGSGSVVYGLFANKEDMIKAKNKLEEKYENIYTAKTITSDQMFESEFF